MSTKVRSDSYPGHLGQLPSGSWRWRVSINGERHSYTWSDVDEEGAASRARAKYDELADRVDRGRRSVPLSRFSRRFEREHLPTLAESSQNAYSIDLRAIRTFFELRGDPNVSEIDRGDVKGFAAWRRMHKPSGEERDEPLSSTTVRGSVGVLSVLMSHAVDAGLRETNPVSELSTLPSPDRREPYLLSDEEYEALLEELEGHPMARLYVLVVGETGIRTQSEASWLRWEDIDWEGRGLEIVTQREGHTTKTDESRWVPASDRLMEALREHAARFRFAQYDGEQSPWVFHHVRGHRDTERGDRVKRFTYTLDKAADAIGLPDRWRPYDLRHMRLTRWGETGKAFLVQKAAGHADISTTQRYVDVEKDALRQLVDGERGQEPGRAGSANGRGS